MAAKTKMPFHEYNQMENNIFLQQYIIYLTRLIKLLDKSLLFLYRIWINGKNIQIMMKQIPQMMAVNINRSVSNEIILRFFSLHFMLQNPWSYINDFFACWIILFSERYDQMIRHLEWIYYYDLRLGQLMCCDADKDWKFSFY